MKAIAKKQIPSRNERKKMLKGVIEKWIMRTLQCSYIALARGYGFSGKRLQRFQMEFAKVFDQMCKCGEWNSYADGTDGAEVDAMYGAYIQSELEKINVKLTDEGIVHVEDSMYEEDEV